MKEEIVKVSFCPPLLLLSPPSLLSSSSFSPSPPISPLPFFLPLHTSVHTEQEDRRDRTKITESAPDSLFPPIFFAVRHYLSPFLSLSIVLLLSVYYSVQSMKRIIL